MSPRWIRARSTTPILRAGANAKFAGRNSQVSEVYERLTSVLRSVGPVTIETKRTSLHLIAGSSGCAFAGVHPQKSAILLNIHSAVAIDSPRLRRVEQVSKHRFHNELLLTTPDDVNGELLRWLKAAYELASSAE